MNPTVIQFGLLILLFVGVAVAVWQEPGRVAGLWARLRVSAARWLIKAGAYLANGQTLPGWPSKPVTATGPVPARPLENLSKIVAAPPTVGIAADQPPPGLAPVLSALRQWDDQFGFDPYRLPLGWTVGADQTLSLAQVTYTPGKKSSVIHAAWTGKTGKGKDVSFETALLAMTSRARPDQLMVVLIDGKGLDYHAFRDVPHLCALAEAPDQVAPVVALIESELDARRQTLQDAGVKNVWQYAELRTERPDLPPMPIVLVYVAEILMLKSIMGDALWSWLNIMLTNGRAFGLHFVISSQRLTGFPTDWRSQIDVYVSLYQQRARDDEACTSWSTRELTDAGAVPPSELPPLPGYATVVLSRPFNTRFGNLTIEHEKAALAKLSRPSRPKAADVSALVLET